MIRLFEQHRIRKQKELEGLWDFSPVKDEEVFPCKYEYKMAVPGCWEMHPAFLTYRGRGAYRKHLELDKGCGIRLTFKGISHTADVFFDGKQVGQHYNAYTPFSIVLPCVPRGSHELTVLVDNSFSEASSLHIPNDYYTYGGIIRPVVIEEIPGPFIERVEFIPYLDGETWKADISVLVKNIYTQAADISVKGSLDNFDLDFGNIHMEAGIEARINKTFPFPYVKPWSGSDPQLYFLKTEITLKGDECPCDDLIERVGFRTTGTDGTKILINNGATYFKGFNRHEDHPTFGAAIPFQMMVKDLELMLDTGANIVRTSHYPNDERFLDLCDEKGIYIWEENHARGLNLEAMKNPNFNRQCEDCNREMVQQHINHPSIIMWGILNECASFTEEGREMYKQQFDQIKALDKSRPLTFASCYPFVDLCLDLVDIVSFNIYAGWYIDTKTDERFDEIYNWIQQAGGRNKPIIVSEFGAAAIYGLRGPTRVKWSEERQSDILEDNLKVYLNRPEISGSIIWQFCDCRVTEEGGWFQSRAGTKNNKGIFDEYRRPKLSYQIVKEYFNNCTQKF